MIRCLFQSLFSFIIALPILLISCKQEQRPYVTKVLNPIKEVIFDNLASPWSMAFISDHEALLAEKDGNLLRLNFDTKEQTVVNSTTPVGTPS